MRRAGGEKWQVQGEAGPSLRGRFARAPSQLAKWLFQSGNEDLVAAEADALVRHGHFLHGAVRVLEPAHLQLVRLQTNARRNLRAGGRGKIEVELQED